LLFVVKTAFATVEILPHTGFPELKMSLLPASPVMAAGIENGAASVLTILHQYLSLTHKIGIGI
jgi:hypothetical protein